MPVALVTGCSSGIGLATALHFARRGYDVFAGVRNVPGATELSTAIVLYRAMDMTFWLPQTEAALARVA